MSRYDRYHNDDNYNNHDEFQYISVADRKKRALKEIKALRESGKDIQPVEAATSRGLIAKSFWGKAWCKHLEAFSNYAHRLPRGRSYIRHSAVVDLKVLPQEVTALVYGSQLYKLTVTIEPIDSEKWEALKANCKGRIGSLIELLQGKLSDEIMSLVVDEDEGLFPRPSEIRFNCNCPDYADMCKHVAASLYGVGARLDAEPELLFTLRGVDQAELIALDFSESDAASDLTSGKSSSRRRRTLDSGSVGNVFGIDLNGEKDGMAQSKHEEVRAFIPSAEAVRELRDKLGLSKAAFAREVGVSAPTISNWEKRPGMLRMKPRVLEQLQRLHDASC